MRFPAAVRTSLPGLALLVLSSGCASYPLAESRTASENIQMTALPGENGQTVRLRPGRLARCQPQNAKAVSMFVFNTQGATLRLSTGDELTVPAGALSQDTQFRL